MTARQRILINDYQKSLESRLRLLPLEARAKSIGRLRQISTAVVSGGQPSSGCSEEAFIDVAQPGPDILPFLTATMGLQFIPLTLRLSDPAVEKFVNAVWICTAVYDAWRRGNNEVSMEQMEQVWQRLHDSTHAIRDKGKLPEEISVLNPDGIRDMVSLCVKQLVHLSTMRGPNSRASKGDLLIVPRGQ